MATPTERRKQRRGDVDAERSDEALAASRRRMLELLAASAVTAAATLGARAAGQRGDGVGDGAGDGGRRVGKPIIWIGHA